MVWKRRGGERLNCWEAKACGREKGGEKAAELGVCPAALEDRLDGVHGGKKGGRACWMIAGTFCQEEVHGLYAQKYLTCKDCEFYQRVHFKEGMNIIPSEVLLRRLDKVPG